MSSIKSLYIVILVLIFLSFLPYMTNNVTEDVKYTHLDYSVKTATLDATAKMIDTDKSFDGDLNEYQNVELDLNKATKQFHDTFNANMLIPQKSFIEFSNMNIPLTGFITYRSIVGMLSNGSYVAPYSFTITKNNIVYNFTLGTNVYILNNDGTEKLLSIDSSNKNYIGNEHFFSPTMTNLEFRNFVVIEKINKFLSTYSGRNYNLVAKNTGKNFNFTIAQSDFSSNKHAYNPQDAIIDGVGFFAIIDIQDSQMANACPKRLFTFGGAELLLTK